MAAADLLDPQWHWLRQAIQQLYREIDPGAQIAGVMVLTLPEGENPVEYFLSPDDPTIHRFILTEATLPHLEPLMGTVIDATPDGGPPNDR